MQFNIFLRGISLFLGLGLLTSFPVTAQPTSVPLAQWELSREAEIVTYKGQNAIKLGAGAAVLKEQMIGTGYIEFDMLVSGKRSFPGFSFHGVDRGNFESFYIRPHQSGNPDAVQYTPVFNGRSAWQVYAGEGANAATEIPSNEWFRVRLDIYQDSALISINGEPALHIPDLIMPQKTGFFRFSASFDGAYYSNVSMMDIPGHTDPITPAPPVEHGSGTIESWNVSSTLSIDEALARARTRDWKDLEWGRVEIERNGFANISKMAKREPENATAIARFSIESEDEKDQTIAFGFSDEVTVFVNGRPVFHGNDAYLSRDYRFLGTVGFYDEIIVPLTKGENEITFVTTEVFGGWAVAARLVADGETGLVFE